MPQKIRQLMLPFEDRSEAPNVGGSAEAVPAVRRPDDPGTGALMELVVDDQNLWSAMKRVLGNKGSPGIDGMPVEALAEYWGKHGMEIRQRLLYGTYHPLPVRRREIPKSGGGVRELGIPTVLDRLVQQALLQVLQPLFDVHFSEHSHGFRPGRSAHGAIREARAYIQAGRRWVVDVDLEKFFDRVNHDVLMVRVARRVTDRRVLRLIRRYLEAGVMLHGVVVERHEGTPQGGPLSPLLANILLDDVDKALERRGHAFVRYADDCNVYMRSRKAGDRVFEMLRKLYGKLRLRINESKSAVDLASRRKLLGYSFWFGPKGVVKCRLASKTIAMLKEKVRIITKRTRGQSLATVIEDLRSFLPGWKNYFALAEVPRVLRELDEWIRHRLRAVQLKHWKRGRTMFRELMRLGASKRLAAEIAASGRRWWKTSGKLLHTVLTCRFFDQMGVPRLAT